MKKKKETLCVAENLGFDGMCRVVLQIPWSVATLSVIFNVPGTPGIYRLLGWFCRLRAMIYSELPCRAGIAGFQICLI